jgi:Holliday junction resolvase RusA-like endonuclease
MSWTPEQLLKHPNVNKLLLVNMKSQKQATEKPKDNPEASAPGQLSFVVIGDPMGKPRMTQRDRWKQRPVVLRYHDYCDRIKEAAPNRVFTADVYAVDVIAHITMPASWSKKKKTEHAGKMCRSKPDWDNIGKAICDALFKEDSMIADGRTRKFWCCEGEQRTEVLIHFNEKPVLPQ